MKNLFLFSFLVFSLGAKAQDCAAVKAHYLTSKSVDIISNEELKYDVKYHKLEIELSDTSINISNGKVTTIAKVIETPFTSFVFELLQDLAIDSVKINGVLRPVNTNGDARTVSLNPQLNLGDVFTAEIYYNGHGNVNNGFFSGITTDLDPDYNVNATWTLSESFHAYEWWPCKQLLTDKIDSSDVWITVANGLKAGSNGVLEKVTNMPGNKQRFEWKSRHPIDYYLISASVADYVDYSFYAHPAGYADSVLIQNYIYNNPQVLFDYQAGLDSTRQLLEFFSEIYGLYPFADEKYGHCQSPIGGGMEHQTMTTLYGFDFSIVAHELSHQWFGDNVTCGTWKDIWVNEGFADYSEYLATEHFRPTEALATMNFRHAFTMFNPGGSTFCPDTTNENRIFSNRLTYNKGGAIIHTLRFEVNNDSLFFAGLRLYQAQRGDSTGKGSDIKSVYEGITGLNLTDFFNQWYYGEGYPTISLDWNQANGQTIVVVGETTSAPNITPFFKTSLQLKLNSAQGDTTVRVYVNQNNQAFVFNWNKPIQSINIDPNQWVINANGAITHNTNLVGVETTKAENGLKIFPVPTSSILTFNATKPIKAIRLFDMAGRVLNSYTAAGENTTVDISELAAGAYIAEVYFIGVTNPEKRLIVKE